jgi:hypothetical protein
MPCAEEICDPANSFDRIRMEMRRMHPPCVPYLAPFLAAIFGASSKPAAKMEMSTELDGSIDLDRSRACAPYETPVLLCYTVRATVSHLVAPNRLCGRASPGGCVSCECCASCPMRCGRCGRSRVGSQTCDPFIFVSVGALCVCDALSTLF